MIEAEHRRLLAGYRMPAEWEPHLATYLAWPHNVDTWPGKFDPIPMAFAQIAAAIGSCEPVRILLRDRAEAAGVKELIAEAVASMLGEGETEHAIEYAIVPTNDSWVRDHGPIFVNRIQSAAGSGPAQIALDWRFNSWGEKYGAFDLDDVVPHRLAELYGFDVIEPGIVLEGGSIDVNGAGSLLTTEACLLNPNRNPSLSRAEIEDYLKACFGVNSILWLGDGIAGDDTDGHVDDLARFVDHRTIVTIVEDDPADANYKVLQDNLERLQSMRDQDGRPFRIETLPMPPGQYFDGTRLPASYANFYIANGGVIVPVFGCNADPAAIAVLTRLFPGREIIGVPSADLVWGLGAIHCLTQQHPAPYAG
ncbi:MAG: agmatine deiminase family protein [Candidatus Binataceae bacterium]|jgi:agmatine deiminase